MVGDIARWCLVGNRGDRNVVNRYKVLDCGSESGSESGRMGSSWRTMVTERDIGWKDVKGVRGNNC